jgi:peptidoglycan/LPS O-acetylase OafA/YrhL
VKKSQALSPGVKRFAYLDFIRALACLPVLISHLNPNLLPGGGVGVGLFFALSGFLIAQITEREVNNLSSAARFLVRRIFRVFPLMIADLALLALAYQFFYTPLKGSFFEALPSLLLMQSMPKAFIGIGVGVLWTLQIEFAFYILAPMFALAFGRRLGLWIFSIILVFCSSGLLGLIATPWGPELTHLITRTPILYWGGALGIGVLLHLISTTPRIKARLALSSVRTSYIVLGIGIAGIIALFPFEARPETAWHYQVLIAATFGATLILAWIMRPGIYVLPGAAFIGRISFSVYLIHAVLADFAHYVHQTWGLPWISLNPLVFAPIVIALSWLSYKIIEQPGIRLGKKISDLIPSRPRQESR